RLSRACNAAGGRHIVIAPRRDDVAFVAAMRHEGGLRRLRISGHREHVMSLQKILGRLSATLLTALALASPALAQPADLVLRGGRIITVDGNWSVVQALAIRAGRFVAVGMDEAMAPLIGPNTQVIELAGRTVVPGLIDSHLHQILSGLNARG